MAEVLPSNLLTDEHRRIDVGVKHAADGDNAALATALELLRSHLYVEETVLFPPLAQTGLTMPVFVMKREHGEMWPLLEALAQAAAGEATPETREHGRRLFQLLQMHNPKEESLVYTAADRLAGQQHGALTQAMADAKLPDGWRCAMAPKTGP